MPKIPFNAAREDLVHWSLYKEMWEGLGYSRTPLCRTSFLGAARPEGVTAEVAEQCACDECGTGRALWQKSTGLAKLLFHHIHKPQDSASSSSVEMSYLNAFRHFKREKIDPIASHRRD
uniref:Uncharacterized protein n=1 Tax=Paramoeba aestuarina TaxID=180227 RepID=A0A7S4L7E3_9EUKA|mmetsp:Transcript_32760/g.51208  ORF Transcript_32760/g.51208 Transcript_32760/m.51208 type:complete len:119 (+) Transcript_32760:347-703(+)